MAQRSGGAAERGLPQRPVPSDAGHRCLRYLVIYEHPRDTKDRQAELLARHFNTNFECGFRKNRSLRLVSSE
jgi:hypothetical protein